MKSISDIKYVYYINLDKRPDRREHVQKELEKVGIHHAERFSAISTKDGRIGCSMSHLAILELARTNEWEHVMIVEDDIMFLDPGLFAQQFNTFLSRHHDSFDVVLLSGNNCPPHRVIDDTCVQVSRCQTTTGYLVMRYYYEKLIDNYRTSIQKLLRQPHLHLHYAIDKYWFQLQQQHRWFLIVPLTVIQRADYSDIENKLTDYSYLMLDLDKARFFK